MQRKAKTKMGTVATACRSRMVEDSHRFLKDIWAATSLGMLSDEDNSIQVGWVGGLIHTQLFV